MNYLFHPLGKWAYQKKGNGPEVYLIFHGFGQSHGDMLPLDKLRKEDQTFLFMDMFYHGKSQWKDSEKGLDRDIWKDLIQMLSEKEGFGGFHLIGYSMGGKFSLLTYELFSNQIKSITLLAPDGIKTGLWYSMNNYPNYVHPLFKRVVFKPNRFFGIVDSLQTAGFLEKSLVKFVKTQMETRSKRAQAYFAWKVFGRIQLQLGKIIRLARKNPVPFTLILGEFDKMVTEKSFERFSSKIPHLRKIILPVGHGGLIQEAVDYLKA